MESWISALSSLVLVGVTAWYAVLTNRLAKSARDSAASAERTASLTAEALAASIAALDVGFAVFPNAQGVSGSDGAAQGVSVQCTGATVFVHRVHLDKSYRIDSVRPDGADYSLFAEDIALVPDTGGLNSSPVELPIRMHRGEMIHLEATPEVVMRPDESVGILEVSIWYSLTQAGEQLVRRVGYTTDGSD
ncbi:hypothetical protein J2D78_04445 [Microbacterium maritypicum]|uniref:hypothetical protein n=1 Tax=Microbacterium maritypicum TaxID=33918 RepID=UPI001B3210CE|nr:hypothetical protein [Microbacterium liquefaciens]MBP5801328.1 hypothetical protein [Microbacterium liquefaciens]